MMTDIHSHDPKVKPSQKKVLSLSLHPEVDLDFLLESVHSSVLISAGVHPWHALEWPEAKMDTLDRIVSHSRIAFIGEIGLDKSCKVPFERQKQVLEKQLYFADLMRKPVLLHLVGFQSEILALKRVYQNIPAWIVHGFRGKATMAEQYLRAGFYLSFGWLHQEAALRICPDNRLFLETDESQVPLDSLYELVARERGQSVEHLEVVVRENLELLLS